MSKWVFGPKNLDEVLTIRKAVLRDELGYDIISDIDDDTALHVLVGEDDTYYATGRLFDNDGKFEMGMICVDERVRGKKLGSLIARILIDKGFELLADEIYLKATDDTVGFFEKLNFEECGSEYTDDNGIKIVPMVLKKENSPIKKSCDSCGGCDGCSGC